VIRSDDADGGLVLTADAPGTALRRTSQAPGTRVAKWRRLCDDLTARAETLRRLRDEISPKAAALETRAKELDARAADLDTQIRRSEMLAAELAHGSTDLAQRDEDSKQDRIRLGQADQRRQRRGTLEDYELCLDGSRGSRVKEVGVEQLVQAGVEERHAEEEPDQQQSARGR
jgi:hypothetical protein